MKKEFLERFINITNLLGLDLFTAIYTNAAYFKRDVFINNYLYNHMILHPDGTFSFEVVSNYDSSITGILHLVDPKYLDRFLLVLDLLK